jgi:hypothetical protein
MIGSANTQQRTNDSDGWDGEADDPTPRMGVCETALIPGIPFEQQKPATKSPHEFHRTNFIGRIFYQKTMLQASKFLL